MNTLPLFLNLADRPCLVVGGGNVAARKIEALVDVGAKVTIVAPHLNERVAELVNDNDLAYAQREFDDDDVAERLLVIAATNVRKVNAQVFAACQARSVLVNTVDDPQLCTAIFPSIVDREPVTVAISTGGSSPTLARRIREQIEAILPASTGRLAMFLAGRRSSIKQALGETVARQRLWDRVLDSAVPRLVERGDEGAADEVLDRLVSSEESETGWVSLVGAGPGDPDLLTLKGLRTLQRADIVYYDNLVSPAVLDLCRRDAERVYVGKRRDFPGERQSNINDLLLASARRGMRVVRLKGGDPFIFGRGGEEIETLSQHGIDFEVVPGITAALGCAAYAGIPLTHRDWAQSVRFVTGHLQDDVVNLDWPELARPDQTLVVYMGLTGLKQLAAKLIEHGADPATPAALISRGTLEDQIVIQAPLVSLAEEVEHANVPGPTTTIIGRVVALRDKLGIR